MGCEFAEAQAQHVQVSAPACSGRCRPQPCPAMSACSLGNRPPPTLACSMYVGYAGVIRGSNAFKQTRIIIQEFKPRLAHLWRLCARAAAVRHEVGEDAVPPQPLARQRVHQAGQVQQLLREAVGAGRPAAAAVPTAAVTAAAAVVGAGAAAGRQRLGAALSGQAWPRRRVGLLHPRRRRCLALAESRIQGSTCAPTAAACGPCWLCHGSSGSCGRGPSGAKGPHPCVCGTVPAAVAAAAASRHCWLFLRRQLGWGRRRAGRGRGCLVPSAAAVRWWHGVGIAGDAPLDVHRLLLVHHELRPAPARRASPPPAAACGAIWDDVVVWGVSGFLASCLNVHRGQGRVPSGRTTLCSASKWGDGWGGAAPPCQRSCMERSEGTNRLWHYMHRIDMKW